MPYNMDGSDSDMCARARSFGRRVSASFGLPWESMDERLTTREARALAEDSRAEVDSASACLVLESWFREHPPPAD
jgi:putative Holliday junction resolvase